MVLEAKLLVGSAACCRRQKSDLDQRLNAQNDFLVLTWKQGLLLAGGVTSQ